MYAYVVCFVLIAVQGYVDAGCNLSLKDDFGQPSPVYLQNGGLLAPNSNGNVTMARSDTLRVLCPGDKRKIVVNNVTSAYNDLEAHCIINNTFRVDRWIGAFSAVKCSGPPWYTVEETKKRCNGGNKIHRVGYKIGSAFHQLYEACFDQELKATLYVLHEISPKTQHVQPFKNRPKFFAGDLFDKVPLNKLYTKTSQADIIDNILGSKMSQEYLSKNQYLTRGHLAPRADFPMRAEQQASFHYINTAPQWFRGNAGDWAALEEALRRRVLTLGRPVKIITGTHGVMTLADSNGNMKPVFLNVDQNNNQLVPVPMYFYKVLYDTKTKTAVAFISINSSFYDDAILNELTFCEDVCGGNPKFSWLRWRANDGTFSFCCEYDDFVREVIELPHLNVQGLFY